MFLVLIEYIEDGGGKEWSVVAHGAAGLRCIFPTREAAEKVARDRAQDTSHRFAVVEIKSWYQQEVRAIKVVEAHRLSSP